MANPKRGGRGGRGGGNPLAGQVRSLEKQVAARDEAVAQLEAEKSEVLAAYTLLREQALVLHERVGNGQQIIAAQQATLHLFTTRWLAPESGEFRKAKQQAATPDPADYTVQEQVDGSGDYNDDDDVDEPGYPSESYDDDDDGDFPDGVG